MADCPWYVSAHAVDRFRALTRRTGAWDDDRELLLELCAAVWQRYQDNPSLQPVVTRTGAYQYRGPGPHRLSAIVSMAHRPEGDKPQVVDVTRVEAYERLRRARR